VYIISHMRWHFLFRCCCHTIILSGLGDSQHGAARSFPLGRIASSAARRGGLRDPRRGQVAPGLPSAAVPTHTTWLPGTILVHPLLATPTDWLYAHLPARRSLFALLACLCLCRLMVVVSSPRVFVPVVGVLWHLDGRRRSLLSRLGRLLHHARAIQRGELVLFRNKRFLDEDKRFVTHLLCDFRVCMPVYI